ncbi:hypothetical protein [Burkholderia savannae]|uniref:hypothetical protein n=1 Tax=Burkholderia savannae TaxID=1637837 RepID=UPI0012E35AE0|nr:hypothetical protein [Burkholderia savannae]
MTFGFGFGFGFEHHHISICATTMAASRTSLISLDALQPTNSDRSVEPALSIGRPSRPHPVDSPDTRLGFMRINHRPNG